jgi:hypothetical protein
VTHRFDDDVEYEPEVPPRGRRWISVIFVVGLAATCSALAFLWRAYGDNVATLEYPHWLMAAGACLVVVGFVGLGISRNRNLEPAEDNLHPAAPPNSSVAGGAEGEETSARHSSAGLWKPEDDDRLRTLAASGETSFEIGRLLHRSPSAVRKRASLLGITVQG